jgi:hypothetical protein
MCCECCQEPEYEEAWPLLETVLQFYKLENNAWMNGWLKFFWHHPTEGEYLIRLVGQIYKYYNSDTTTLTLELDSGGDIKYWMTFIHIYDSSLDYVQADQRLRNLDKTYFSSNKWGIRRRRSVLTII